MEVDHRAEASPGSVTPVPSLDGAVGPGSASVAPCSVSLLGVPAAVAVASGSGAGGASVLGGGTSPSVADVGAAPTRDREPTPFGSTFVTSVSRAAVLPDAPARAALDVGVAWVPRVGGSWTGEADGVATGETTNGNVAVGDGEGGDGEAPGVAVAVGWAPMAPAVGPESPPPADRPITKPSPALTTSASPTTITIVRCISNRSLPGPSHGTDPNSSTLEVNEPHHDATHLSPRPSNLLNAMA